MVDGMEVNLIRVLTNYDKKNNYRPTISFYYSLFSK